MHTAQYTLKSQQLSLLGKTITENKLTQTGAALKPLSQIKCSWFMYGKGRRKEG